MIKKIKSLFLNDNFILILIVFNAFLIFFQEFDLETSILNYIEYGFTIIFITEMIIKTHTYGFKKYIKSNWNRFDFILVLISIPSLATIFYDGDLTQLNVFLTFRAFRIFKFFRLIRFFPNINSLVISIQRALKASYVVIAGFFLSIFIISLVSCSLYKTIAPEFFGNPLDSFYSIFRLFSIEGWYEIPDTIAERTNPVIAFASKLYFIILLLCGGIIGLSLVNSIFVDAMVSDNNDDLEAEVKKLNKKIDTLTEKIDMINKN